MLSMGSHVKRPPHLGVPALQTSKSTRRLEQIANLRARGVGDHISLPQLVVCGDQSAGKSSVLEGITGIPFPRDDGVCTKFATEIIMQHSSEELVISASIIPDSACLEQRKQSMLDFHCTLKSFDELPKVISKAGALMGLRGFNGRMDGPAFGKDTLRIKMSGPTGLHLTLVDLPGLIETPNEEQTDKDRDTVHQLADLYLANPRTIILAVVQASNDIANQLIIRKSKSHDKAGDRTVGIITKPDLVNAGTEKRIALLAKNQDSTKLKLGFFLVKNPAPKALEDGITLEERLKSEKDFFASSPWKEQGLDADRTGISALKAYLQILFDRHIERHLPKVREEVYTLLDRTQHEMYSLGDPRTTAGHCRTYLSRLSMNFNRLCSAALNGTYQEADAGFFDRDTGEQPTRLRAEVHRLNVGYSDYMRTNGGKRRKIDSSVPNAFRDDIHKASSVGPQGQMQVSEKDMKDWIAKVYRNSRGKELPGTYNHVLLSELFHDQSRPWKEITEDHIDALAQNIERFVQKALDDLITDEQVLAEVTEFTSQALRERKAAADAEFAQLWRDENQQPITYNHYFTDNVQNSRRRAVHKMIEKPKLDVSNSPGTASTLEQATSTVISALKQKVEVDMEKQACSEASSALEAYYKVARKTFVDNVCRQVIERHLLRNLPNIFSPETIAEMEDDELMRIAGEMPASIMKRKELSDLYQQLTQSLKDLRK